MSNEYSGQDLAEDVDFDSPEIVVDLDETGNQPKQTTAKGSSRASRATIERARRTAVKDAIAKTLQVAAVDAQQRAVAAAILGCTEDVAALTEQILMARKGATRAVTDLLEIADADDPLEAGISASILAEDKARLASAWRLAQSLGALPASSAPAAAPKAAATFGRAVLGLDDQARAALSATMELIG